MQAQQCSQWKYYTLEQVCDSQVGLAVDDVKDLQNQAKKERVQLMVMHCVQNTLLSYLYNVLYPGSCTCIDSAVQASGRRGEDIEHILEVV